MKLIKIFLSVLPIILLTGCSSISSPVRQTTYLQARSIPPLKVPPGISSSSFHNQYPVSSRQYPLSEEDVSLVPPGL